jgi:hypothetical protein
VEGAVLTATAFALLGAPFPDDPPSPDVEAGSDADGPAPGGVDAGPVAVEDSLADEAGALVPAGEVLPADVGVPVADGTEVWELPPPGRPVAVPPMLSAALVAGGDGNEALAGAARLSLDAACTVDVAARRTGGGVFRVGMP